MKKKDKKKLTPSLGGNELPKGSRRIQGPSRWDGVKTPPSFWDRADMIRSSLGMSWGIKQSNNNQK